MAYSIPMHINNQSDSYLLIPEIKPVAFTDFIYRVNNKSLVSQMQEAVLAWRVYFLGTIKRFQFLAKFAKRLLGSYIEYDEFSLLELTIIKLEKIYQRLGECSDLLHKYARYIHTEKLAEIFRSYILLQDEIEVLVPHSSELSKGLYEKLIGATRVKK